MTDVVQGLQRAVNNRQDELGHLVERLPAQSKALQRRSQIARVVVILAGALVAARESVVGDATDSRGVILFFSALGIVIAAVTGLESYFKWEGRAFELRTLGESARSTLRAVDSRWEMVVRAAQTDKERITGLTSIVTLLDTELDRTRDTAARLGVGLEAADDPPPREVYPA